MITIERLRHRINETNAWEDLRQALELNITAEQLKQSAPDWYIQTAYGAASVKSETLRQKLHAHPIPDWNAIGQYSDFSLLYHLESGLTNATLIAETIAAHAAPAAPGKQLAVLDFGAGLGRILRYLYQFVPEHSYAASEVNPLAVDWAKQVYREANVFKTDSQPPLPLPSASIDVAYAWSIFSHYAEELHLQWLKELARVLKPGGLLIVTVQGRTLIDRMAKEPEIRHVMRLGDPSACERLKQEFETAGYSFYESYGEAGAPAFGINAATFGMAFISPDYMAKNWMTDYELVKFEAGMISNWQDYAILRRR